MSFVVRRSLPTALRLRAAFAAPPTTAVLSSPLSPQLSARSPTSLHTSPPLLLLAPSNSPRPPAPPSPSPPPSPPVQLLLSVLPMSSLLSSVPLWLCCVAAYVGLSGLLLYFPSLLSPLYPRRREVAYSVRYGAHRGGGGERIENTIAAFEHAVACGCSLLELDVHLTKDGHVVVLHDSSLLRTTGQPLRVNDINFADLPRSLSSLAAPPPFSPPGTLTSHVVADGAPTAVLDDAYRIPLLSAVLKRFPHSVVNVDLKDDSDQLCDATIEVVEAANAHDRVIWGSMHSRLAARMSEQRPDWHMFCSPREVMLIYFKFVTGLLPFLPVSRGQYMEIPYIGRQMRPMFVAQLSPRLGPRAAELLVGWVAWLGRRPALFQHLQQRGHPVILWVLNEPSEMRDALEHAGAAGIMTDYPEKMQRVFKIPSNTTTQW